MRLLTRIVIASTLAVTLAGCSRPDCTPGEPGPAASSVRAVSDGDQLPVTVTILGWESRPHPQVPDEGDKVFFRYRVAADTGRFPPDRLSLQVCAIDAAAVVLGCTEIGLFPQLEPDAEGDDYISVPTADRVVVVPDQMDAGVAGCNEDDLKDGYGYQPPRSLRPGDHIRLA